jgi:hypothetical protein
MLASFHIHDDGSLWFNDTEIVDGMGKATFAAAQLSDIVSALKDEGGFSAALLSFGGGGSLPPGGDFSVAHSVSDSDFKAFLANYFEAVAVSSALSGIQILENLNSLVTVIGADGIDLDVEPTIYSYPYCASAIAVLSNWAEGQFLTWTPYEDQEFWGTMYRMMQPPDEPLSWLNLQPPPGSPAQNAAAIGAWITALSIPPDLIVPGLFQIAEPGAVQNAVAAWIDGGIEVTGAYYWAYDYIVKNTKYSPADFAGAMSRGLEGESV